MWNNQSKRVKNILPKEETVDLIGYQWDGKVITNIEANGQIRIIKDRRKNPWDESDIEQWRQKHLEAGLKFHPGELLTQNDSAELYERLENEGLI